MKNLLLAINTNYWRILVRDSLKSQGYNVVEDKSVQDTDIDVAIIEIDWPKNDWIKTVQFLREKFNGKTKILLIMDRRIPIQTHHGKLLESVSKEYRTHLTTPFSVDELVYTINELTNQPNAADIVLQ